MEAASVHHLPRQAGIDENGAIEEGMPTSLPDAWDVIRTFERKFRAACGQITRLQNELEGKRLGEIEAKDIDEVLEYWRQRCAPRAEIVPGSPKWEKVRARLHETPKGRGRRTVEELKRAVDGALGDDWFNGTHPKSPGYLGWDNIFLNSDRVEKLIGLAWVAEDARIQESLERYAAKYPGSVVAACLREEEMLRQVESLKVLAPCAFEPKPSEVREVRFEEYPAA